MEYSARKVLLTGSHGFVGRALTAYFSKEGFEVEGLPRTLLVWPSALKTFFKNREFDYIIHLASYGNLYSQTEEDEIFNSNIFGTYNLLQAAKKTQFKAFVNFSSSSVLLPHQTLYSASKITQEALCMSFAQNYNLPIFSVRPSTIYGVGDNPAHFIPTVIDSLKGNKKMDVVMDSTHDYINIDDLISALNILIKLSKQIKGMSFNISSNRAISNKKIITLLEEISDKKLKMNIVSSLRPYDIKNWNIDNSALIKLGWIPQITLEEGLTSAYYG